MCVQGAWVRGATRVRVEVESDLAPEDAEQEQLAVPHRHKSSMLQGTGSIDKRNSYWRRE